MDVILRNLDARVDTTWVPALLSDCIVFHHSQVQIQVSLQLVASQMRCSFRKSVLFGLDEISHIDGLI